MERLICRLHFYNTPITDDFREASHPLNIIRSIYEPGDFIVVKLDIDNGPLESAIMAEIAADPELRHCISEMFYEQPYDHAGEIFIRNLRACHNRATCIHAHTLNKQSITCVMLQRAEIQSAEERVRVACRHGSLPWRHLWRKPWRCVQSFYQRKRVWLALALLAMTVSQICHLSHMVGGTEGVLATRMCL